MDETDIPIENLPKMNLIGRLCLLRERLMQGDSFAKVIDTRRVPGQPFPCVVLQDVGSVLSKDGQLYQRVVEIMRCLGMVGESPDFQHVVELITNFEEPQMTDRDRDDYRNGYRSELHKKYE